jgi:Outer membrane protein beta-barrel domain
MTARPAAGLLLAASAFAAHGAEIRPLLVAGLDFGGDKMLTVVFDDGDTQDIRANDGFYLGGGVAVIDAERRMEYQLTAAVKYALIDADNGEVEWTRFPIEALAFYRFPRVRLGGGLTYHMSPRIETSGAVGNPDVKFKNALGAVLQADWLITDKIALGGRYTILEYDAKGDFAGSAKSNGIGISFSMRF